MHLRSRGNKDGLNFIDEIEAFARHNKTATKRRLFEDSSSSSPPDPPPISNLKPLEMAEEEVRPILVGDYVQPQGASRNQSAIVLSPEALRLNIQPQWLTFITGTQFTGKSHEDPHTFIEAFYDNIRFIGITEEQFDNACMRIFPLVLIGEAKDWLKSVPPRSFTTWTQVENAFLTRFFPPTQIITAKAKISAFKQGDDEEFHEAWARFQRLLRKCPNHGYDNLALVNTFYNGLSHQWKIHLDATAGGSIELLEVDNALRIINRMAATDRSGYQPRSQASKPKGVLELSASDAILAQSKLMTEQVKKLTENIDKLVSPQVQQANAIIPPNLVCELCNGNHPYEQCPFVQEEQVQYMSNNNRQGNFSSKPFGTNNFSTGNLVWKNNQGGWNQGGTNSGKSSFATLVDRTTSLEDTFKEFLKRTEAKEEKQAEFQKNTQASIRNLEIQVGQISKQLADMNVTPFSAHTKTNSNEHCNFITTRSGLEIGKGIGDHLRKEKGDEGAAKDDDSVFESEGEKSEKVNEKTKELGGEEKNEKNKKLKKESVSEKKKVERPQLVDLPYPPKPSKKDKERQFQRFLDIFQRLQINIPFMEAMEQMPTYSRFMKELLTKKKRFKEETIQLEAGCSAILQKTLPLKSQDPGSFTIPVDIGSISVGKALMDLGASINLMPLSMIKRIGDVEVKPTRMTLQ